ncbi:APH(3') family aminoglycoside O-phosphotransferase [Chitinimonas sp.]|uniref:APH(3') family aminoglycoside O-phosphotransferase n=1 Tax=Chitinimonas sp. TaxID=1934313 RepID=UPI002F92CAFA
MSANSLALPVREVPADAPPLPHGLLQRLAGFRWTRNLVGQAGATVYRLAKAGEADLYLKYASAESVSQLIDEMTRLRWLSGLLPAAMLEYFEWTDNEAWLPTRALPGRTAYQWLTEAPERSEAVVTALAQCLQSLHLLPPEQCPYHAHHSGRLAEARRRIDAEEVDVDDFDEERAGWTAEQVWQAMTQYLPLIPDPVVSHGDYSLDNILLDEHGQITGLIDLGRLGVADRYQDLAILWNCLAEFGPELQQTFFKAYGLAEPDEGKLTFHLCLDECF